MVYVLVGVILIFLAVTVVKVVEAKGTRPYFLAYLVVILAGFYGMVSVGRILDLLKDYPLEALHSALVGVISLKVAHWGLTLFGRMQAEA